ncbi:hypothetical protein BJY04DRAFT_7937 [Aspergillus karnatakaensis]|uniref:uncharacterized protein n=1 Tax=Aspergillus karnatakaensis TaxID=1810916 RepID=UPI003CCDD140
METGITVFHKDETLKKQKEAAARKPKRGPLDVNEQIALIKVCEKRAKFKEISDISSSKFWTGIEVALEREIGRRYSHYSCRRRIIDFLAQRSVYHEAIKNGEQPPFQLLDPEIRTMLDTWKEMDEFKEQLEKEKALSQLVGHDPEVPQSNKLKRVADWVRSLPDPEPHSVLTPPSTDTSHTPVNKEEALALWARYQDRANARANHLRTLNHEMASSRQLLSNIQNQLNSTLQDPRAMQVLAGVKRPREEDESSADRLAQRPRTQLTDQESNKPVLKQSPGNSHVLPRIEHQQPPPPLRNTVETVFGKFWESMLPYFKERAMKDGLNITTSESIMHELFKEVGSALTRAFIKLEQNARPAPHNHLL